MTAVAVGAQIRTNGRETRSFERRAMGSPLRLTVTGAPGGEALLAWGRVSHEFERAEQALSRFRETSDLTRLNRAATTVAPVEVDPRLRRALATAWRAQRVTGGRFDPRILADLERLGYAGASIDVARDHEAPVDATAVDGMPGGRGRATAWLALDGRRAAAALDAPVDLGGIGKGLALRWAWRRLWAGLHAMGRAGVLLEAGGDIVAAGPAPDGGPWLVGIEDPCAARPDASAVTPGPGAAAASAVTPGEPGPVAVVAVERGAVCTSSVAIHRWRDPNGRPAHHLLDPATGVPGGAGLLAVTVAGPDPAWAEVWSKALFLEGASGIAEAARRRGLAAWWIAEDGRLRMTPAARPRTAWTR